MSDDAVLDEQEMFNRVWNGLRSQGFETYFAQTEFGGCAYHDPTTGRRCAWGWGWVDTSLTSEIIGTIKEVHDDGCGLAALLNEKQLRFAHDLQLAHDLAFNTQDMQHRLRDLAMKHNLLVPEAA